MAPRLVHNALGPMARKNQRHALEDGFLGILELLGMRRVCAKQKKLYRTPCPIQPSPEITHLRSDRGVCARGYAPGTNGQWMAKRCLLPFLGMRQVQKIPLPTLVDSRARPEITPGEHLSGCAPGYAPL